MSETMQSDITQAEALEALGALTERLLVVKRDHRSAMDNERLARGALADAISRWQCGGVRLTPEQNARDFIRSEQLKRKARAEALAAMGPSGPQRSIIDRMGEYQKHGDANDFARKQMETGHRRGSVPMSALQSMRARARRAKPPSER